MSSSFHFGEYCRFHFVGIGGIGMSGIAEILLSSGFQVSGSDLALREIGLRLGRLGARIEVGHRGENLGDCQALVVSSAIAQNNAELAEARRRGLPILHRSQMLAELMRARRGITVTGTHGKTTTTSMLALVLLEAGLDPTIVNGARLANIGSNARLGRGEYLLAEADESDGSFLRYFPVYSIVTNVDDDHLEHYGSLERLQEAFLEHMNRVPFHGALAACIDDQRLASLLKNVHTPLLTYGLTPQADVFARRLRVDGFRQRYECLSRDEKLGEIELQVPGRHNLLNSLAAVAMSLALKVPFEAIRAGLESYRGAERRLQRKGERSGVWVLDDYGHHPAEIRATLQACQGLGRRILVVYQPHRFTRTRDLMDSTARSFEGAHEVFLMDIYAAGEQPIPGVDSRTLAEEVNRRQKATYVASSEQLQRLLSETAQSGDLLLTMGAGDVWKAGERFLGQESEEKGR